VPERGETQCVGRTVGEIEPAFKRVFVVLRVLESNQARTNETSEFLASGGSFERSAWRSSGDEDVIFRSNR
jgi:hypothetical protein